MHLRSFLKDQMGHVLPLLVRVDGLAGRWNRARAVAAFVNMGFVRVCVCVVVCVWSYVCGCVL